MLRQRLVRQSALSSNSSSSDPSHDYSRSSSAVGTSHQLSAESLNNLIDLSSGSEDNTSWERRHSVTCGAIFIDVQKKALKSVFNSAARRMSSACSFFPSGSQQSLDNSIECTEKSDEKVILPNALGTFSRGIDEKHVTDFTIDINRRFSSDFPPPTYQEATKLHKKFCTAAEADAFKQALFKHETIDSASEDSQDSVRTFP